MKALADKLGGKTRSNTVSNWLTRGVPMERCLLIEKITGVRCEDLRPDLDWQLHSDVFSVSDRIRSSDDAQPPAGTSSRKLKEARA